MRLYEKCASLMLVHLCPYLFVLLFCKIHSHFFAKNLMVTKNGINDNIILENNKGKASGPSRLEVPFQVHRDNFTKLAEVLGDVLFVGLFWKATDEQFQFWKMKNYVKFTVYREKG